MSFRYLLRDDPAPEQRGSLACEMGRHPGVPRSRLARARLPEGIRRRRSQLRHLETATGECHSAHFGPESPRDADDAQEDPDGPPGRKAN